MKDLMIFDLASRRTQWLEARSVLVSSNIANSDVPGFEAKDLVSFEDALRGSTGAVRTHPGHLLPSGGEVSGFDVVEAPTDPGKHSGNTVSLEAELAKVGDIKVKHELATSVTAAFHRMILQSVRS